MGSKTRINLDLYRLPRTPKDLLSKKTCNFMGKQIYKKMGVEDWKSAELHKTLLQVICVNEKSNINAYIRAGKGELESILNAVWVEKVD